MKVRRFNYHFENARNEKSNFSFRVIVKWNYGLGKPKGIVGKVEDTPGKTTQVTSQKGNTITRYADEGNPAVRIERRGRGNNNDVVKKMSELTKVGEGEELEGEGEKTKEPAVGSKRGPDKVNGEVEEETTTA